MSLKLNETNLGNFATILIQLFKKIQNGPIKDLLESFFSRIFLLGTCSTCDYFLRTSWFGEWLKNRRQKERTRSTVLEVNAK